MKPGDNVFVRFTDDEYLEGPLINIPEDKQPFWVVQNYKNGNLVYIHQLSAQLKYVSENK